MQSARSRSKTWAVLVAGVLLTLPLFRAVPLVALRGVGGEVDISPLGLAGATALPFLALLGVPALTGRVGAGRAIGGSAGVVAVAAVVVQLTAGPLRFTAMLVGLGAGLALLGVAAGWLRPFAAPVLAGVALDTGLRAATGTRDLPWIDHWSATLAVITAAGVLVIAAFGWATAADVPHEPVTSPVAAGALGPVIALEVTVLANQGWVAQVGDFSWTVASAVVVGGAVAGALAAGVVPPNRAVVLLGGAVVAAVAAAATATGWALAVGIVLGQLGVGVVLGAVFADRAALSSRTAHDPQHTVWATTVGHLVLAAAVGAYYAHAFLHLPLPPRLVLATLGVLVLVAAVLAQRRLADPTVTTTAWAPLPVAPVLLAAVALGGAGVVRAGTAGDDVVCSAGDPVTIMTFNVGVGATADGELNLEEMMAVIDAADPDVLALQEVSRGMLLSAGGDQLGWLRQHLDHPYVAFHASVGNPLYGNALMSRVPFDQLERHDLPDVTPNALSRSLMVAELELAGEDLTILNTHLQAAPSTRGRTEQAAALLDAWGGRPRALVVGDFNATPGSPTMELYRSAGFQPATDDLDPTFPSWNLEERLDWLLHTPDLEPGEAMEIDTLASDHLPVLATFPLAAAADTCKKVAASPAR